MSRKRSRSNSSKGIHKKQKTSIPCSPPLANATDQVRTKLRLDCLDDRWIEYKWNYMSKRKKLTPLGCWYPIKKSRSDGYVRFSITKEQVAGTHKRGPQGIKAFGDKKVPDGEKTFYLQTLAFYKKEGYIPDGVNSHVSHLCDKRHCFNPDHLIDESARLNNLRKNCLGSVNCHCSSHPINICQHGPPFCIRHVTQFPCVRPGATPPTSEDDSV